MSSLNASSKDQVLPAKYLTASLSIGFAVKSESRPFEKGFRIVSPGCASELIKCLVFEVEPVSACVVRAARKAWNLIC